MPAPLVGSPQLGRQPNFAFQGKPLRGSAELGCWPLPQAALHAIRFVYTLWLMEFTWSERKRSVNLKQHGLDFVDVPAVFAGLTFTFEDDRFSYKEQRFVTLGLLAGVPVSIVHTETAHEIRIISFRQATRREAQIFFDAVQD